VAAPGEDRFGPWFQALETRHLSRLTFGEVRRGLQALSSLYVERRGRLGAGEALEGAGKRAAFALFYGPLHFLLVRGIVRALGAGAPPPRVLVDLGCGTGAAGAAWALEAGGCRVAGIDRSGWAVEEARWNYRALGLPGTAVRGDVMGAVLPGRGGALLAAFTLNEIEKETRAALRDRLLGAARLGASVLVVEPIARRSVPWWAEWSEAFRGAGGRDDEWRFAADLPERLRLFDRAARLDHGELTGRSLWVAGVAAAPATPPAVPAGTPPDPAPSRPE
jgi:SAM-dependent methyltransferase